MSVQLMEYSYLLDLADECEDPHMRLVYASKYSFVCVSLCVYQCLCLCFCLCFSVCMCAPCFLRLVLAGCSNVVYICILWAPKNLEAI
jgi:hypothetical protein